MRFITVAMAVLLAAEGLLEAAIPGKIKFMLRDFYTQVPVKSLGVLYCFMGVSLNFSAVYCRGRVFVAFVGSILFALGFAVCLIPEKHTIRFFGKVAGAPDYLLRIWGFFMFSAGIGLFMAL